MRKLVLFFFLLAYFLAFPGVSAQDSPGQHGSFEMERRLMLYSHPELINQWSLTKNPAGLLFFDIEERVSRARSLGEMTDQHQRRAMDPGRTRALGMQTESLQQIGNVNVRGLFGYQNTHYDDLLYNGNMDFRHNRNLYMVGDTIGGRQRQEGYYFLAELAHPLLGDRLFGGVRMNYESAVGAKMQDLRNRNTISKADFTTGLIYNYGNISAGLSGGYVSETNFVNIRAELDERHTLFYHMGMGHYSASGNFSGSESVRYEGGGYHAGLNFQYTGERWQTIHSVDYYHLNTEALVGNSYRLINGITDYDRISYRGSLLRERPRHYHHFRLHASAEITNATEVRQRSQSQPIDGVYYTIIHTIRWIEGKHIINDVSAGLDYQFIKRGNRRPLRYQLTAGASLHLYDATHYPVQNYGYYDVASLLAKFEYQHFFSWRRINISPVMGLGGRFVADSDAVFIPFPNYLENVPETDHFYYSENYYRTRMGVELATDRLPVSSISSVFMGIHSVFTHYPDIINVDENHNFSMSLSLGITF